MKRILFWFITIDLVLFAFHHLLGLDYPFFNLDVEQNLPTYYQGLKLIIAGVFLVKTRSFKLYGLMLLYLALDEVLALHENLSIWIFLFGSENVEVVVQWTRSLGFESSSWLIFAMPIVLLVLSLYALSYKKMSRDNRSVINLSVLCFIVVLWTEGVGSKGSLSPEQYFNIVAVEELFEMIGVSNLIRLKG